MVNAVGVARHRWKCKILAVEIEHQSLIRLEPAGNEYEEENFRRYPTSQCLPMGLLFVRE